eukprot:2311938-Amphidinium_carterae.1
MHNTGHVSNEQTASTFCKRAKLVINGIVGFTLLTLSGPSVAMHESLSASSVQPVSSRSGEAACRQLL